LPQALLHLIFATWERGLEIYNVLESGLPRRYSFCGIPQWWSAELQLLPFYIDSHAAPYLFGARLYTCKTDTRRII
jgi:hypothetical protein